MALPCCASRRRARPLDWPLLAVRGALLGALARFYARRGAAFWLSPLADPGHRRAAHVVEPAPDADVAGPDLRRRASRNSAPMSVISAPVAATRSTGSTASWIAG